MSPFQKPFDRLKGIERELSEVQSAPLARLRGLIGAPRTIAEEMLAQTERTYLIRLLTEFEGALTEVAPSLSASPAITFGPRDGLGFKLDQIGAILSIDPKLRSQMDDRIRDHRNELAHARSLFLRVPFDQSKDLMFEFLRFLR